MPSKEGGKTKKIKKSLAQEVRQKRDFWNVVCNTSNCITVRLVRGHLTPKMNIAFFIRNLMRNIFLFNNFFEKKMYFQRKFVLRVPDYESAMLIYLIYYYYIYLFINLPMYKNARYRSQF